MTENHVQNYCARTELLLRMLDGDLAPYVTEGVKEEIERVLRCGKPSQDDAVVVALRGG